MKKITLFFALCVTVLMCCPVSNAASLVVPPEGATIETYSFSGYDTYVNKTKTADVFIAFVGNDVYIQGLSVGFMPDGWVKGTLVDNVITLPKADMGTFDFWGDTYELTFNGAEFAYDPDSGILTSTDGYTTEAEEVVLDEYTNVVLTPVEVLAATPATPTITDFVEDNYGHYVLMTIPLKDVEGNDLTASYLSYQMFYDIDGETSVYEFKTDDYLYIGDENLTVIPYNFTDSYDIDKGGKQVYLYSDDLETWTRVGVKSIYTGGGETHESEIFWYEIPAAVGIEDIAAESQVRYFDLQGRPVSANASGIILKQVTKTDGTTRTVKVMGK